MAAPDTAQTLSRGLDVLELLASSPVPRSAAQVAGELGLSRTIVYRLVGTLVEHRLVRRDPDGLLSVGLGALRLTEHLLPALRESTREILERLAERAVATAHLCVADGEEVLAVSVVEPQTTTFHVAYRVGSRTPRGLGGIGQAIEAAREGRFEIFESEGRIVRGATGVAAPLPASLGLPATVGVVTLAGADTASMVEPVREAVEAITAALS